MQDNRYTQTIDRPLEKPRKLNSKAPGLSIKPSLFSKQPPLHHSSGNLTRCRLGWPLQQYSQKLSQSVAGTSPPAGRKGPPLPSYKPLNLSTFFPWLVPITTVNVNAPLSTCFLSSSGASDGIFDTKFVFLWLGLSVASSVGLTLPSGLNFLPHFSLPVSAEMHNFPSIKSMKRRESGFVSSGENKSLSAPHHSASVTSPTVPM